MGLAHARAAARERISIRERRLISLRDRLNLPPERIEALLLLLPADAKLSELERAIAVHAYGLNGCEARADLWLRERFALHLRELQVIHRTILERLKRVKTARI